MNRAVQRALLSLITVLLTVPLGGAAEPQPPAEPKTLADLNQPPVAADQDAATYLREVRDNVKALRRALAPTLNQPKDSIQNSAYDEEDRKALRAALDLFPNII